MVLVRVNYCVGLYYLNLDLYMRLFYSLIIHSWMQSTCTKHVLMEVCDIIVAVSHAPKVVTLGKSMKSTLYTGISVLCWCRGTKLRCTDTDSEFMNKYT